MNLSPKKTALLVIDMQNAFTKKKAPLEVKNINKKLYYLKHFIDHCRTKGIKIIYTRHIFSKKTNPVEAKLFPKLRDNVLRKGAEGFEINPILSPDPRDTIIDKTRYDAFYKTKLESILRSKKISDVLITGTMTEVCSESTARSGMFRNFNIFFISDMNFTSNKQIHLRTLKVIGRHFGHVISSRQIK